MNPQSGRTSAISGEKAFVHPVTRFMARCFVCGIDEPATYREDAEAWATRHNAERHPVLAPAPTGEGTGE